jgi:hypothetical protein
MLFLEILVLVSHLTISNALKLRVTINLALKVVTRTTEVTTEAAAVVVAVAKVAMAAIEEALNSQV